MFDLPELEYDFKALEPHIDAQTMEIHHSKHHGGYVTKLNTAIEETAFEDMELDEILQNSEAMLDPAIRNNGGGHFNHSLFWSILSPDGGGKPSGTLAEAIDDYFESFDKFKEEFSALAAGRFGSGWAWLLVEDDGTLAIASTPNQDNSLMPDVEAQGVPILGLDVWEHAYYLNYQNKRGDYIKAFWNVVNWDKVAELYEQAV